MERVCCNRAWRRIRPRPQSAASGGRYARPSRGRRRQAPLAAADRQGLRLFPKRSPLSPGGGRLRPLARTSCLLSCPQTAALSVTTTGRA